MIEVRQASVRVNVMSVLAFVAAGLLVLSARAVAPAVVEQASEADLSAGGACTRRRSPPPAKSGSAGS